MSTYIKNRDLAGLREAADKLDSFLAASRGEESSCATFEPGLAGTEEFTQEQRRAIRIYLESWVREPLEAALESILGRSDWTTDKYLRGIEEAQRPFLREIERQRIREAK